MSWRDLANDLQDLLLDEYSETDSAGDPLVVSFEPADGSPATLIRGVFRDAHTEIEVGHEVAISAIAPRLGVMISDLPYFPPLEGDRVFVARLNLRWRIVDHQPDGEGLALFELVLAKQ